MHQGFATNVVLIVIMIHNQRGRGLLYSLSVSFSFLTKMTMGLSVIGGSL